MAGTEDIRSSGAVSYVMRNLFRHSKARLDREIASGRMNVFIGHIWNVGHTVGQLVAFGLGFWFYQQGILTIGAVYLVIHYTNMLLDPLGQITEQIRNFQQAAASIERVDEVLQVRNKIQPAIAEKNAPDTATENILANGPLAIHFDQVSFSYLADEPVLENISFTLQPGEKLGLLGRTGSGKTTLTRLIFRLYDPSHGDIYMGNGHYSSQPVEGDLLTRLRDIDPNVLREQIGMVTQDVQLLRGTVRDNITLFNPEIGDEQILNVIEQLGVTNWFDRLPYGLDTELHGESSSLSAGEGQLLAFTRVFLHNPGLVILDEASSRLDPLTERLIERAVDRLLQNRTAIIVAHRLETVQRADQILLLKGGKIQEYGPRPQLAQDPRSHFSALLNAGLTEVLA